MRHVFFIIISITSFQLSAQSLESIKNQVVIQQFGEARRDIDKLMLDGKQASNPQAQLTKAAVYSSLSMDAKYKTTAEGYELAQEADAAFQKYKALEPSMSLLSNPTLWAAPTNLYYHFYLSGYADYNKQAWPQAFIKLKKAVEYSDLLISKKILAMALDTNVLILAEVTAEKTGNNNDAVIYYKRLADASLGGEAFETVYRYLVINYYEKKDMVNFEKYEAIGLRLYPTSEYFKYEQVDFAIGLVESFEEKLKAVEGLLQTDPQNKKANDVYWGIIYDALNPEKEGSTLPPNAAVLEQKMIGSMNTAYSLNPTDETPMIFFGNHFILKKDKTAEAIQKHASDMRAKTSQGSLPSADDTAKSDALNKQYAEEMEAVRGPYEKAAAAFAAKASLTKRQKEQYRNVAGYLAEIYELKKKNAPTGSPDQKAFEEREAKWDSLYKSL